MHSPKLTGAQIHLLTFEVSPPDLHYVLSLLLHFGDWADCDTHWLDIVLILPIILVSSMRSVRNSLFRLGACVMRQKNPVAVQGEVDVVYSRCSNPRSAI